MQRWSSTPPGRCRMVQRTIWKRSICGPSNGWSMDVLECRCASCRFLLRGSLPRRRRRFSEPRRKVMISFASGCRICHSAPDTCPVARGLRRHRTIARRRGLSRHPAGRLSRGAGSDGACERRCGCGGCGSAGRNSVGNDRGPDRGRNEPLRGPSRSDAALAGAACTLVAACRADSGCFRPGSGGGCLGPSWMAVPVANGGAQGLARGHHWRSRPLAKGGRSAVQGP